ncbi:MAG: secondary thiamine-phosphate synthase enzyme YjbQ [Cyclobacteriaceae bacterium]
MIFLQEHITLSAKSRGFHLITGEVLSAIPDLRKIKKGMLQVFIQHTSASLTINENADPTVRQDFESHFNKMVPENAPYYIHTYEGPDDMPAHIKSSLLGASVMIPIANGRPALGTWQGIYLCEHRDYGGSRKLVVTAWGEAG